MSNKDKDKIILATLMGIPIGMLIVITIFSVGKICTKPNHDDEYIKGLITDNIMLDELNKDLIEILKGSGKNESKINEK